MSEQEWTLPVQLWLLKSGQGGEELMQSSKEIPR